MNRINLPPTPELQRLDACHHLHPFTDARVLGEKGARIIVRAEGAYMWDSQGNRILDAMAGLWCVNVGYARQKIVDAVARQMQTLAYYNTFFCTSHPPVIALSQKLASLAPPCLNRVFYGSSGSEANDTVVRMARHYWSSLDKPEKRVIISRKNAYHGSTLAGASLGGMAAMHKQGHLPIPDIEHIDQPYWYQEGGEQAPDDFGRERARQLEQKIEQLGRDKVAGFIAEPIQGAGGVIIPPKSYWPEIQRICKQYDILLIVDEVICGFGRTANWFGSHTYDLEPDFMPIAKGMTSGYMPMSGVLVSDRVAEVLSQRGGEFFHGYTYSGHPAGCAAALANIEIFEDEHIIETLRSDTAPYLKRRWLELADHPLVGEARMAGFLGAIELTPDKAARGALFDAPEGTVGLWCREASFNNDLVMRHVRDCMVIAPPLILSRADIDVLMDRVFKSLDETFAWAKKEGLA